MHRQNVKGELDLNGHQSGREKSETKDNLFSSNEWWEIMQLKAFEMNMKVMRWQQQDNDSNSKYERVINHLTYMSP